MRKSRWIELKQKDYDYIIDWYLDKVNVLIDELSRKSSGY